MQTFIDLSLFSRIFEHVGLSIAAPCDRTEGLQLAPQYISTSEYYQLFTKHSHAFLCSEPHLKGFQSGGSIHAIHLLTSGLFTVNAMWANWNILSNM